MTPINLLFSLKGRIGRKLFWLWTIVPTCTILTALYTLEKINIANNIVLFFGYSLITWIIIAGLSKRLHDLNQSSWIQFIFFIPASTIILLTAINYDKQRIMALGYVTFLIGSWILIKAAIIKGTPQKNKFSDEDPPYSNNYSLWLNKLETIYKWRVNSLKNPSKSFQLNETQEKDVPSNDTKNINSGVLDSWLYKSDPHQSQNIPTSSKNKNNITSINSDPSKTVEPEILRATSSIFGSPKSQLVPEITEEIKLKLDQNLEENTSSQAVIYKSNNDKNANSVRTEISKQNISNVEDLLEKETNHFLQTLEKRATKSLSHQFYLQKNAESGNSWAKLEIAATWLSNITSDKDQAQRAINYLSELANSHQSHLGAETEASYFLGEIYRIGLRYTRPNEDLSFKYLIRAAALGHKAAQTNLTTRLAFQTKQEDENPIVVWLTNRALTDTESATALLQLITLDWSITYIESVSLVLRTLVDQGNSEAARILGRVLLENNDYETGARVIDLADKLDNTTIDQIVEIIKSVRTSESNINAFVEIIKKHAKLDNSYAHIQMANSFNEGIGMPQDKMMAFVHISLASARIYGSDRDNLIKFRDELLELLTDEEIARAQEIIREQYRN